MRKITQIAAVDGVLYALCSDGTLWKRVMIQMAPEWVEVKGVPQL